LHVCDIDLAAEGSTSAAATWPWSLLLLSPLLSARRTPSGRRDDYGAAVLFP
jgi:uncharacterized protein (TIGR03382 family)